MKGTAAGDIAWQQLKVSSQAIHDLLVSGKASVLRVTTVYGDEPVVFEMRCGQDFRLEPEARWVRQADALGLRRTSPQPQVAMAARPRNNFGQLPPVPPDLLEFLAAMEPRTVSCRARSPTRGG